MGQFEWRAAYDAQRHPQPLSDKQLLSLEELSEKAKETEKSEK